MWALRGSASSRSCLWFHHQCIASQSLVAHGRLVAPAGGLLPAVRLGASYVLRVLGSSCASMNAAAWQWRCSRWSSVTLVHLSGASCQLCGSVVSLSVAPMLVCVLPLPCSYASSSGVEWQMGIPQLCFVAVTQLSAVLQETSASARCSVKGVHLAAVLRGSCACLGGAPWQWCLPQQCP